MGRVLRVDALYKLELIYEGAETERRRRVHRDCMYIRGGL